MARLLITGGTGSFGNAVAKRFLDDKRFSEIVIFSRDEEKQHEMKYEYNHPKLSFVIGDVRNKESVLKVSRGIDYIFHAAALKHVPFSEYFPMEYVRTNIIGTENVLSAAEENGVKKVVLLSTDKAAYPINAMGMTKALAEKLIGAHARESQGTVFCAVRYGNVMASRGSVIPLFVEFIKKNKPLTVTNPEMTRFLISLVDSVDLVALAIERGAQGDLFIKKAPAATMQDLAQAMLNIFNSKSKIKIIGHRAGEKLHETLAIQTELNGAEDMGNFYRIRNDALHTYEDFYEHGISDVVKEDFTSFNARRLSVKEVENLLLSLDYIKKELKNFKK
jgi:UDP-N-acetylglucosamine 4,6-dehydratase/5-epimerase